MPRLTPEREAVIRELENDTSAINYHIIRELLAEVFALKAELAAAKARAEHAEKELAELRENPVGRIK